MQLGKKATRKQLDERLNQIQEALTALTPEQRKAHIDTHPGLLRYGTRHAREVVRADWAIGSDRHRIRSAAPRVTAARSAGSGFPWKGP